LNSYYKTIATKLEGVKFDGTQDLQILSKINTDKPNGTLFAHAFPADWGAKWESGGDDGQGKMLFLRDGRLTFDIGWTGAITGTTNIADGNDHTIGLRYSTTDSQFCLLVDGAVEACGLSGVMDRAGASFMIGVSVGHDARTVADMAPFYKGKIWDFRVSYTSADFATAVTAQVEDPAATDGSDGANMSGGSTMVPIATTTTTETTTSAAGAGEYFGDDEETVVYETVTMTNADGTTTVETKVVGEEEEPTDEQTAIEINMQIDDVEVMKETADVATTLAEKLVKEVMEVEVTKADAEAEEVAADIALEEAEEAEADAELEEEEVDVLIAETEDLVEKTDNALEKADN